MKYNNNFVSPQVRILELDTLKHLIGNANPLKPISDLTRPELETVGLDILLII
jgi:hypothetical protein